MSTSIVLRQATEADAADLRAILYDTLESTWAPQLTAEARRAAFDEDRPGAFVRDNGLAFQVAEVDGAVVGLVYWEDDFVHSLHVRGSHARQGIGARLMDLAETEIAKAGFPS